MNTHEVIFFKLQLIQYKTTASKIKITIFKNTFQRTTKITFSSTYRISFNTNDMFQRVTMRYKKKNHVI